MILSVQGEDLADVLPYCFASLSMPFSQVPRGGTTQCMPL